MKLKFQNDNDVKPYASVEVDYVLHPLVRKQYVSHTAFLQTPKTQRVYQKEAFRPDLQMGSFS